VRRPVAAFDGAIYRPAPTASTLTHPSTPAGGEINWQTVGLRSRNPVKSGDRSPHSIKNATAALRRLALVGVGAALLAPLAAQTPARDSRVLVWSGAATTAGTAGWTAPNAWVGTDGELVAFQDGDAVRFDPGEGIEENLTVTLPDAGARVSAMYVNFSTTITSTLAFAGGPLAGDGAFAVAGSTEIADYATTALPNVTSAALAGADVSPLGRLYISGGSNRSTVEFRSTDPGTGQPVNPSFARDIIYRYTVSEPFLYFNTPGAAITSNLHLIPTGTNHYFKLALADSANFAGDIRLGTTSTRFQLYADTNITPVASNTTHRIEISGAIIGPSDAYGNVYGVFHHYHHGTTVLSGSQNRYGGTILPMGTLLVTSPGALGSGNVQIYNTGHLVFQGLPHTILPMAFFQDTTVANPATSGTITIIDSDLVFRRVPNHAAQSNVHGALNSPDSKFATLTLSGASRLLAIPSGISTSVLGGPGAAITVGDHSTLILDAHTNTRPDLTIPIKTLALDGGTLVLRPGASLTVGDTVTLDGDAKIAFEDGGIARLAYGAGSDPRLATQKAEDACADNCANNCAADNIYTVPAGMSITTLIDDTAGAGAGANTYLVVNQAGHPLKGIAMATHAAGAVMDAVSARLSDNFLQPVAGRPAGKRRWADTAWMRAFNRAASYDSDGAATPGHTGDLRGAVAGLTAALDHRLLLGFHAGLADSELDADNGTNLTAAQRFFGAHLAQRLGRFYLAADLSLSTADSSSRRYSGAGSTIARWDTACHAGGVEAGAILNARGGLTLRPSAALRYMKLKTTDHVETGPGAMEVADFSDELCQTVLALRASQRFRVFKRDAALDLFGSLKNSTTRPRTTLEAAFVSDPDRTPVRLECPDYYYGDTLAFGASLRVNLSKNTLVGLNYERETADHGSYDTIGALIGYQW
jgi:hypothetical protein